eukprot:351879-Chlamydomonas_euryale.AAC.30
MPCHHNGGPKVCVLVDPGALRSVAPAHPAVDAKLGPICLGDEFFAQWERRQTARRKWQEHMHSMQPCVVTCGRPGASASDHDICPCP